RHALLQLEIAGSDLNNPLIEFAIFAVILEPDLFEGFMALKKKRLIEFFNAFEKSRIVLSFHGQIIQPHRAQSLQKLFSNSLCSLCSLWLIFLSFLIVVAADATE